jgi:photosystem II stability/assembly factor-like uncharacterized protein
MRSFLALLLLGVVFPLFAQHTAYVCAATTKEYVVGAKLPPSGVFRKTAAGAWEQIGFNHPFTSALAWDPLHALTLYLAAGNGLIRLADRGAHWRILTGSDVTELRDVAVDPNQPGSIYFSHTTGIAGTHDAGKTWYDASGNLRRRYSEAIRVDRQHAGVLVAGTEAGLFRSENAGGTWNLAGAAGFQVLRVEQSPHDACFWLAATQDGGLFASHDCGRTFESAGALGVGRNLYDLAWDPFDAKRIAVAGFGFGIAVSEDSGTTWTFRNAGLPRHGALSLAFDPDHNGRLYAGVHEEALYVSDDLGKTWRTDGLPGTTIYRIQFVPDEAPK